MNRFSYLLLGTPLFLGCMTSIADAHSTRESGSKGPTHLEQDWVRINPEQERILYEKVKREGIGARPVNPKLDRPAPRQPLDLNGDPIATPLTEKGVSDTQLAKGQGLAIAADRTEHLVGRWDGPVDLNVVAVHTTLLPNGNVLMFDSVGDNPTESYPVHKSTRAIIWNPITKTQAKVDAKTGYNIFCSGHIVLPNGKVFVAGGNLDNYLNGIDKTHTFDFNSRTWAIEGTMARARWYPAITMMSNGEALITGGGATLPEIRGTNGILRSMTGADAPIADGRTYNWLKQAPNGKVAYLGPDPTLHLFNANGTGSWENYINRPDNLYRDYGSFAMYDIGKVIVAGGSGYTASAGLIDLNTNTTQVTSPMAFQRRQHNLTVLADGTVLATGGMQNTNQGLVDLNNAVYPAERWNPATGQWTTMASMLIARQYHSTALLLPDGRVLSAGGGICGDCLTQGYLQKNYEIYSPPYLFLKDGSGWAAPRPQLTNVPGAIGYNQNFTVTSAQAPRITKAAMIRFGGVTHGVNMDQQYIPVKFSRGAATNQLTITSPSNANIAPPGYYMLFIFNQNGVPAKARIMRVS
jgi:hypothetical protein